MPVIDNTYPNPKYAPKYDGEPCYDLEDAVKLVLLFHSGGIWDNDKRAEWLRITGSTEATTKVMCDHLRSALAAQ